MQRKNELSLLNIIFCILVIFIHISSAPVSNLLKGSWQYGMFFVPWRLSAFVVQGFIFLSGLKMFLKKNRQSYKRYYISRFTKIVVPYFLAVTMFYAYFLWHGYFSFSCKEFLGYVLKGDLVSHFYFVIIIVQFYALKPIWKSMLQKVPAKAAVIFSILIMFLCKYCMSDFLYNDRLFTTYLVYWVFGCYVGENFEKFSTHINKHKNVYIFSFFVIAITEAIVSYLQFVYGGMHFLEELHFVYCISAILFMYVLASGISGKAMKSRLLQKIDNASYYIYLVHPLFIFISDGIMKSNGIVNTGICFLLRSIFTYTLSIIISTVYLEAKGTIKGNKLCQSSEKQQ